jgi:hypothetical protein
VIACQSLGFPFGAPPLEILSELTVWGKQTLEE